ncbi:MAG TPA: protease modulator HflK, partial [Shewanella frigidimarina]|nr:protease modulator HflK [Shewanella frigidimarina]
LPARPPEEVKDAFDDAISAQEDEQRFIREAEAYAREIEPKARGTVERMAQQASAYKEREVLEARGKVARFEKLLPEYKAAPGVTRNRLYIDAMQSVLGDTYKVLIDTKNSGNLMYLPLDKLMDSSKSLRNQVEPEVERHINSVSSSGVDTPITSMPTDGRLSREDRIRQGRN